MDRWLELEWIVLERYSSLTDNAHLRISQVRFTVTNFSLLDAYSRMVKYVLLSEQSFPILFTAFPVSQTFAASRVTRFVAVWLTQLMRKVIYVGRLHGC